MIFWLRLKLDLLPCIAQEIDKVSAEYLRLIENLKRGDKSALQNILVMQAAIKARIEEIDAFYEKNYTDYRIAYFEKLKIKLRKLLYTSIETGIKTPEPALNSHLNDPFKSEEYGQSGRVAKKNDPFASEEEKLAGVGSRTSAGPTRQGVSSGYDDRFASSNMAETFKSGKTSSEAKVSKGTTNRPTTGGDKTRSPLPTRGKESSQSRISASKQQEDKQKKPIENQDEIVFTIKMTKEEYMQFLQTKAAKGK